MLRALVAAALLVGSLGLHAQKSYQLTLPSWVVPLNSEAGACPLGMHARQGVSWDTLKVRQRDNQSVKSPFGQRIILSLIDAHPGDIIAGTVVVSGLDGKNRVVQTAGSSGRATKTVRAKFVHQPDGSVSADLFVPGFTAITSLRLQDVTYSDGSMQDGSGLNACHVAPDPLMLIAAH